MSDRPSLEELRQRLRQAYEAAPQNTVFEHTKSQTKYTVVGHCIREEDGEVLVRYRFHNQNPCPVNGTRDHIEFTRPLLEFLEPISTQRGPVLVTLPRFRRVEQKLVWDYVE
jgi:hypothetical protein